MRNFRLLALTLVLTGLLLLACAPKATPISPAPAVPAAAAAVAAPQAAAPVSTRPAWEVEWERIVAAARKEGALVLYSTAGTGARTAVAAAFAAKYGIKLESVAGRGPEIGPKLIQERRAGIHMADVWVGGGAEMVEILKPAGALDSLDGILVLPEVLDPKVWWDGQLPWVDKGHTMLYVLAAVNVPITINTNLVKPGEMTSYKDLLNPKWKGNMILNDPTIGGTPQSVLHVVGWELMDIEFLRQLVKQEPIILRDQRLEVEWLTHGKYPVLVAGKKDVVNEFIRAGAPIQFIMPAEGCYVSAGSGYIGLIKQAPHPNAARLFINWFLSKEGGTAFSRGYGAESCRIDVPTEGLDQTFLRKPGMRYIFTGTEEYQTLEAQRSSLLKEIFGPLAKK